jgi:hypothetical protein
MFSGIFPKKPDSAGEKALGLALSGGADDDDDNGGRGSSSKRGGGGGKATGLFDPSGLERAAKAAKELDKSANAKEALRLIETQETTKQKEAEAHRVEYEAHVKSLEIQRVQKASGGQRKSRGRCFVLFLFVCLFVCFFKYNHWHEACDASC